MNWIKLIKGGWLLSLLVLVPNFAWATLPPIPDAERCKVLGNNQNDGPDALRAFETQVANFFLRDEDWLERDVNEWNTPSCVFDDGRPRLIALTGGYSQAFRNEKDWSKSLARVEYLKKKFPKAAFAALAESRYWIAYAWNARGNGYASSVTAEGWKLYRERLEKAERALIDTKTYSAELPVWYNEMLNVQSALGRPAEERDKVFLEGTQKYKTYYPLYFTMLNFLLPKWGGSWETVDNLVKWSVENTKAIDGNSIYARLYWAASGSLSEGGDIFKLSRASWPKMKQGFEDLMVRHPKSKWNLNNFARFACQAGDKKTFLKIRQQMGKNVIEDAWTNPTLDLCEIKFGYAR